MASFGIEPPLWLLIEMNGLHSFWSRPGQVRNWDELVIPDYELLTMMLSALEWRRYNGPIRMVTDTPGARYFARSGLTGLWDEVSTELDRVSTEIDPFLFWAAGKLYALRAASCPCAMLDTDLIIWKRLEMPPELDIVAAHGETLHPQVYPDPKGFALREGYRFPEDWDFSLDAANTAFLYLKDAAFRDSYTECAIRFMQGAAGGGLDPTTGMCFAEQRILPMCAKAERRKLGYLLELEQARGQDLVTHIWGYKHTMEQSEQLRNAFCVRCVRRLLQDFPAWEQVLLQNETLSKYVEPAYQTVLY